MRKRPLRLAAQPREIKVKTMTDNQTWNDCPECGKSWQDYPPIPGLLHRTRLCAMCYPIVKARLER